MRALAIASLLLMVGCVASAPPRSNSCDASVYGAAPPGATVVYVHPECAPSDATGSLEAPFPTIAMALAAASAGQTILVGPGAYSDELLVDVPVTIIGQAESVVTASIYVQDAAPVTLTTLRVSGAAGAGVIVNAATVTLEQVVIENTAAGSAGPGYGLFAGTDASVTLSEVVIRGSASAGALFDQAHGTLTDCAIEENAGGGLVVQRTVSDAQVALANTLIADNQGRGIALYGARLSADASTEVTGTRRAEQGIAAGGDGIVAAAANGQTSVLTLDGTRIEGNARIGVLVDGGSLATLDGVDVLSTGADSTGSQPAVVAGIWAQGADTRISVTESTVAASRMTGVGVVAGAHCRLHASTVSATAAFMYETLEGSAELADGVLVADGATVALVNSHLNNNERAGLILDGASGGGQSEFVGTAVAGSPNPVVLQNNSAAVPIDADLVESGLSAPGGEDIAVIQNAVLPVYKDSIAQPEPFPIQPRRQ